MVKIFGSPVGPHMIVHPKKYLKASFLTLCLQHFYSKLGLSSLLELMLLLCWTLYMFGSGQQA